MIVVSNTVSMVLTILPVSFIDNVVSTPICPVVLDSIAVNVIISEETFDPGSVLVVEGSLSAEVSIVEFTVIFFSGCESVAAVCHLTISEVTFIAVSVAEVLSTPSHCKVIHELTRVS